jgi:hypothetical protein
MIKRATLCVLALAAVASPVAAQADRWQVALGPDTYVWDVQLVRLDGDSLVVSQSDSLVRVPVERITELRLIRKTEVEAGADAGDATMRALAGGDDEVYDLSTLELADRRATIQKILRFHPTTP